MLLTFFKDGIDFFNPQFSSFSLLMCFLTFILKASGNLGEVLMSREFYLCDWIGEL